MDNRYSDIVHGVDRPVNKNSIVGQHTYAYTSSPRRSVLAQRIGDIVAGKRTIIADQDLRLTRFFRLSHGY